MNRYRGFESLPLRHGVCDSQRFLRSHFRRPWPGRLRLFAIDRLLWIWLYRIWPRCLDAMVLVKPATAVTWKLKFSEFDRIDYDCLIRYESPH